jgi:transposase
VAVDPTGKAPGRGAYIGPSRECLRLALERKALERALDVTITPEARAAMEAELYKRRASCPWREAPASSGRDDNHGPARNRADRRATGDAAVEASDRPIERDAGRDPGAHGMR